MSNLDQKTLHQETLATHAGHDSATAPHGSVNVPLYLTNAFDFGTSERGAKLFALQELGQIYTRLTNPTVDALEARIAAVEGGKGGISASSGSAAIFNSIINLAGAGDNIIVAKKIYGGSSALLNNTLKNFGITSKIFDSDNADDLESLIDDKTKAIFFESLSNPQIAVADTQKIAKIADKYGVVTITDNTVATPALYQPLKHGADVSVSSATKYICGNGSVMGGVIATSEHLNAKLKSNKRYPYFNEPEINYHGLVFASLPDDFDLFTLRIKVILLRDIGACLSPFNAWQLLNGLETLNVRMDAVSKSALKIAEFLESHPKVKSVNYPALKSSPNYEKIQANFKNGGASGLMAFEVSDKETALKIANSTKIFRVMVNIGDSKSIITHPASTTHAQLSEADQLKVGISGGLIRLSIGLENTDDLINDLKSALA